MPKPGQKRVYHLGKITRPKVAPPTAKKVRTLGKLTFDEAGNVIHKPLGGTAKQQTHIKVQSLLAKKAAAEKAAAATAAAAAGITALPGEVADQQSVIPGSKSEGFSPPQDSGGGGGPSGGGGGGPSGGGGSAPMDEQESGERPQPKPKQREKEEEEEEEYEEETDDSDEYEEEEQVEATGEDGGELAFPLIASHIHDGKLHTIAFCFTPHGCELLKACTKIGPDPQNWRISQPLMFGAEYPEPIVDEMERHLWILSQKAAEGTQEKFAGELVDRARVGDQNAMAIISLVRENSQKGNPRAIQAHRLMKNYIDKNPVNEFGVESPNQDSFWAAVMLSNGPLLSNHMINVHADSFGQFGAEEKEVFLHGVINFRKRASLKTLSAELDPIHRKVLELGKLVGQARCIQTVRMPGSIISRFCPRSGWELGE